MRLNSLGVEPRAHLGDPARSERGATAVLVAGALVMLMGVMTLGLDGAILYGRAPGGAERR